MKKRILNSILLTFLLLIPMLAAFSVLPVAADSPKPEVVTVKLEGPLNPIWKEILQRALDLGEADQAQAVIVELNTTGGSIDLMNQLINMIRTSPVPVVMYVSPESSVAASAGTLLVMRVTGQVMGQSPVQAQGIVIHLVCRHLERFQKMGGSFIDVGGFAFIIQFFQLFLNFLEKAQLFFDLFQGNHVRVIRPDLCAWVQRVRRDAQDDARFPVRQPGQITIVSRIDRSNARVGPAEDIDALMAVPGLKGVIPQVADHAVRCFAGQGFLL